MTVSAFAPGGALADRLESLSWFHRLKVAAGAFKGLKELHKAGLTHGNLKSTNVFVSEDGLDGMIGDADLTKPEASELDDATRNYLDPTFLATGESTPFTDVYSMGVILLELLTSHKGKVPPVEQDGVTSPKGNSRATASALRKAATAAGWPAEVAQEVMGLAAACVRPSLDRRKTALQISISLEHLVGDEVADAGSMDKLLRALSRRTGANGEAHGAAGDSLINFAKLPAEKKVEMELAALKIQAVQRGKIARKEVERLKVAGADDDSVRRAEEQHELAMRFFQVTPKEQKAAIMIQSAYRGKLARRQVMKVLDQKMVKDDDASGGNMSKKDLAELETVVALAEIFSRLARMLSDANEEVQLVAATALTVYIDRETSPDARKVAEWAVNAGVLGPLVSVFVGRNTKAAIEAASCLEDITVELPAEQIRALRAGALEAALRMMSSKGDDAVRAAGARALRGLLLQNPPACRRCIEKGGLDVLMGLVEDSADADCQIAAYSALMALSDADSDILQRLGAERLVDMAVQASTAPMRAATITFVSKLARDSDTHEQIIEAGGLELMLGMLYRLNEEAAWGLASMSSVEDNWPSIDEVVDDEGVESLRDLLVYAGDYGKEGSAWAVCYMAGYPELQVKLVRGNLLMPLIEMVKSGTRRCKKAAERALKALAA